MIVYVLSSPDFIANTMTDSGDADGIDSDMTKDEVGQVKEESDILC